MPLRCIASQISVETHLNDRTVQTRMHEAWRLVTLFPATVSSLSHGRITKPHADAILDTGAALDDPGVRSAFEAVVLEWAESETVGRTRAYARQLAERLDPRTMRERHEDAADERSITLMDLDHGMSQIIILVPTIYAHATVDRLTRQATAIIREPGGLGAIRAHVQITMPITSLTGVSDGGAEVDGKAPIDPATARRLAGATRV